MTSLGFWTPFINEPEMRGWYQLPPELQAEANRYRPDGREMQALSPAAYAALHRRTAMYARGSVAPFSPAYHNDFLHFAAVEAHGLAAADAYATDNPRKMPPLVRQAFGLALRTHDAHHCASTFRSLALRGVYRPELGMNVSSEWVTSLAVNEFMRQNGLNPPTRLFQTGVIWSSTFGGNTPTGQRLRVPSPQPSTIWGCIMRAADVCPPNRFRDWLKLSAAVSYGEVPAQPTPDTIAGFVEYGYGFASYIEACFKRLDTAAGSPLTRRLGWRGRLDSVRQGLGMIANGDRALSRLLLVEVGRYGKTLG